MKRWDQPCPSRYESTVSPRGISLKPQVFRGAVGFFYHCALSDEKQPEDVFCSEMHLVLDLKVLEIIAVIFVAGGQQFEQRWRRKCFSRCVPLEKYVDSF